MDKLIDKRGYLNKDYMLFHLCDRKNDELNFHYHEFDKLVFMLSGKASYIIEGKEYFLESGDVLLVNHHDIHKPVIDVSEDYNRIVIWMNRDFAEKHSTNSSYPALAFKLLKERSMCLLRPDRQSSSELMNSLTELEEAIVSEEYGADILADALFLKLLVLINRLAIKDTGYKNTNVYRYDEKINEVIRYINENPKEDLSLEALSEKFFMSRSYLMHKFKTETGYTIHNYVLQKRLLYSRELLKKKLPVNEVAYESGFGEYSTYLRAFKKNFKCLPKEWE